MGSMECLGETPAHLWLPILPFYHFWVCGLALFNAVPTHSHKNKICGTQNVLVCPLVIALKVNHGKKRLKHYQSENLTINWNIL